MASQLTREEVAHIADLARLELSASEQETFALQLTDILSYAATVQQVDTSTAPPPPPELRRTGRNPLSLRSDVVAPGIARDEAIAQAPDGVPEAGFFRVPKVI